MGPQDASKLANHALVVAQHQPGRDLVRECAHCWQQRSASANRVMAGWLQCELEKAKILRM